MHSCRNRHCPQCQSRARDAWRSARLAELLNVPYCHLVFTLPHELNALAGLHPRWVYDTLMQCTAATLSGFAANPRWLGGTGAFTLVLHTWTQDLRRHLHVHALMACGALQRDGQGQGQDNSHWVHPKRSPHFLFPVQALSNTHRTAVGNERLLGIEGEVVSLRVRANDQGGKRVVRVAGEEFIGRLLQHVLPSGFKRIRHYGLLAPASKGECLSRARALLQMPQPQAQAIEDALTFMRRVAALEIDLCPRCQAGRLRLVQLLASQRSPTPEAERAAVSRSPP